MDYQELCNSTIDIVKEVGQFIRQESKRFSREDIAYKGRHDLVTYVDKEAESQLIEGLNKLLPGAEVMAEEEHTEFHREKTYNWIIDPLDGTLNFVHQIPTYSISVALMEGDEVKLGVVLEINHDECFYAYEGGGAFLNNEPLKVSGTESFNDSLFATGFPVSDRSKIELYLDILRQLLSETRGIRRIGSAAVDLCYLAAGRFDGYYEFNLKAWDVAAGAYIVRQSGGTVTDFKGGKNYIFGGEIMADNSLIHKEFLDFFQSIYKKN